MKNSSPFHLRSLFGRFIPVAGMAILAFSLWMVLGALKDGHYDPRAIGAPSKLHPIPDFKAQALFEEKDFFDSEALKQEKKPVLVVFFSSWCIACISEMPFLKDIAKTVPLWGVDYDDKPAKGRAFVKKFNVDFERVDADQEGIIGANWGLTGVPESFLVMPGGKIAWHADGPIDMQDLESHIIPLIQHENMLPSASMMTEKNVPFPTVKG
ncbi:redoxin domain-containing protein [Acetobacteraceae bacterium]|nr:redoxin domain-containing protein [Acetobacteraceae bacterium]